MRGENQDEDAYWKSMFANMEVLPFDAACAGQAAAIYKDLKGKGQLIEAEDLFIGATAKQHGLKMVTGIINHFERIVGLQFIPTA